LDGNCAWFDGASQNSGSLCGAGGYFINCDGSRITWTLNCGFGTNTKAELLGAWASIYLATRHNILDLHLRGDSKIIIDWLRKRGKLHVSDLECWKDRILELSQTFSQIKFSHIYREQNTNADLLSKKAFLEPPGILTYHLGENGLEASSHSISIF
jgi:ribonuclease HI